MRGKWDIRERGKCKGVWERDSPRAQALGDEEKRNPSTYQKQLDLEGVKRS